MPITEGSQKKVKATSKKTQKPNPPQRSNTADSSTSTKPLTKRLTTPFKLSRSSTANSSTTSLSSSSPDIKNMSTEQLRKLDARRAEADRKDPLKYNQETGMRHLNKDAAVAYNYKKKAGEMWGL